MLMGSTMSLCMSVCVPCMQLSIHVKLRVRVPFDVNSPNMPAALPAKVRDQIAADKPSGATHKYLFVLHNNPILTHDPRLLQTNITEIPWPSSLFFLERSASSTKL